MSIDHMATQAFEKIHEFTDPDTGLSGVIAIHSLRLGPAVGGCRFWRYEDRAALVDDARRLAEGMSYKNALAGLPLGGGKSVLQRPSGDFDRAGLFEAFGRVVESLGGDYITAEDVGTSIADMTAVSRTTRHVAGLAAAEGQAGGDPSPWTARGVFLAMGAAVERRLGRSLDGVVVAVQGLGQVGFSLCELLHDAGARLIVAEPRSEIALKAVDLFGAELATPNALVTAPADVFAPCALGGILNPYSIPQLKAKVVCGAANNQLETGEDGARLARHGVLYAPDYLVNSGGIINAAAEHLGWSPQDAAARVDLIPARLNSLLDLAERMSVSSNVAADAMARDIIAAGRATEPAQRVGGERIR